jgi:hypothetical protein
VKRSLGLAAVVLVMAAAAAFAQTTRTASATLSATVVPLARLTVSSNTLAFPDADPDTVPSVPGVPSPITITAKARALPGSTVLLTVQATDDLRSGVDTIPASAISWTATGPGFVPGSLSRNTPRTVASWSGPGTHAGSQSYTFANSWSYATGTYSLSLVYTLTVP